MAGFGQPEAEEKAYHRSVVIGLTSPAARSLRGKILLLLCGIYFLALALLIFSNIVVYQNDAQDLMGFWALQMIAMAALFIPPGYFVSMCLLRPLTRWLDEDDAGTAPFSTGSSAIAARRAAFNYPWQAIVFFAAFGIVGSGVFHLSATIHDFGNLVAGPGWWKLVWTGWLFEFSLAITLGIVYFTVARRMLRPFLVRLPAPLTRDTRRFSFRARLLVTVLALAVTSAVPFLQSSLVAQYENESASAWDRVGITMEVVMINLGIGLALATDTAADLTTITGELRNLAGNRRGLLHKPLAVASDDEIGDLVLAFNALQARAEALDRELEQDLELARKVQAELLPNSRPRVGGWHVDGISLAAKEVGGDFYDILDLGNGRLGVAVGDASGRGMPAALLMAATIGFLRSEAVRDSSPAQVMTSVNNLLCGTIPPGTFVSLLYMVADTARGTCSLCSAGHVDPLVLGKGETAEGFLAVASMPLGVDPEASYVEREVVLSAGQRILLYTDGIVEARDAGGKFFGFDRLQRAAEALYAGKARPSGREAAQRLFDTAQEYVGQRGLDDDLTAVIVEAPWRTAE